MNDKTQIVGAHGTVPYGAPRVGLTPSPTEVIRIAPLPEEEMTVHTLKAPREPYKPGPIMKVSGWVIGGLIATFVALITGITLAFLLWKYFNHLFN